MLSQILLYALPVVVLAVAFFGVKLLKDYGVLTEENQDTMDKALVIADLVLEVTKLDDAVKKNISFILNIADLVSDYLFELEGVEEVTKELIEEFVLQLYDEFDVEPTENEWKLIDIVIQEAISYYNAQ